MVVQEVLIDFFFQAEDGIRDKLVTGVQTCALPISFVSCNGSCAFWTNAIPLVLDMRQRTGKPAAKCGERGPALGAPVLGRGALLWAAARLLSFLRELAEHSPTHLWTSGARLLVAGHGLEIVHDLLDIFLTQRIEAGHLCSSSNTASVRNESAQ